MTAGRVCGGMGGRGSGGQQVQAAGFQPGLFIHKRRGRRRGQLSTRPHGEEREGGGGAGCLRQLGSLALQCKASHTVRRGSGLGEGRAEQASAGR